MVDQFTFRQMLSTLSQMWAFTTKQRPILSVRNLPSTFNGYRQKVETRFTGFSAQNWANQKQFSARFVKKAVQQRPRIGSSILSKRKRWDKIPSNKMKHFLVFNYDFPKYLPVDVGPYPHRDKQGRYMLQPNRVNGRIIYKQIRGMINLLYSVPSSL